MGRARKLSGVEARDASIRIFFWYHGEQVKETLYVDNVPLAPTPANLKYANRVALEIRDKIRLDDFRFSDYFPHSKRAKQDAPLSLGEFLETWYKQLELKASTLRAYRYMIDRFWKPKLGHKQLKAIKHTDITTVLKEGGWKSGKTRNNYLSMLSGALGVAVHDELIERNPCEKIELAKAQTPPPDPFSQEEVELILDRMRAKYPEQAVNFFEFMFFTGLRTGEGIALSWGQIDFRRKTMLIDQAFVVDRLEDTKTSVARTVNLNSRALAVLERQKAHTFLAGERVFHDPGTGAPWAYEQNARKRYWAPTLKALGMRYRRPYTTRHTFATMGLMAGANSGWMAAQLGHGLDVFQKRYAKWIATDQDARELEKLEQMIAPTIPKVSPSRSKGG